MDGCAQYIFGQEVGESGTPHLQGCVRFHEKQRFTAVKKLLDDTVHWSKMRKKWSVNVTYCLKESKGDWGKIHGNIPEASRWTWWEQEVMDEEYPDVVWYPWQQDVIDIIEGKVDKRAVYWFWDPVGDSGKSYLMKWLFLNYECILGDGKKADVFNQVANKFENPKAARPPKLILLDIPRSAQEFIVYGAIEHLKNGMVNSGKYVGAQCCWKIPHVVVFANMPPHYEKMSGDRWRVKQIKERKLVDVLMGKDGVSGQLIV